MVDMKISSSDVVAVLINPLTDGAVPIACQLQNVGNAIQIHCGGLEGWIVQIPIQDLQDIINEDDLHG